MCYSITENVCTFCPRPKTLGKTKIKRGRLTNLVEEISTQLNLQAVAWVKLADFSQVYDKNQEQTSWLNDLKRFKLPRKAALIKWHLRV